MTRLPANRLGQYADVREILDAALASGGGTFELPSHGAAVHWRQRAYRFRKMYAQLLPARAESTYDRLSFPRLAPGSSTVTINVIRSVGKFTPATGGEVPALDQADDLLSAALAFGAKIDGSADNG